MTRRGAPLRPPTAAEIRSAAATEAKPLPPAKPTKRTYTAQFKQRVLREVNALGASGERGSQVAYLRREGLTWSHVHRWQKELETAGLAALEPKKPGPKKHDAVAEELARLRRQNEQLHNELRKAEIIIDVQKKLSALLGVQLPASPDEEKP